MQEQSTSEQHLNKGVVAVILIIVLLAAGIAIWYAWKGVGEVSTKDNTAVTPSEQSSTPSASEQKAIDLVKALPEVQTWLKLFPGLDNTSPETGGKAFVEVDHEEGGVLTVHVYEILRDHTATLGWYSVDTKTWKVRKNI